MKILSVNAGSSSLKFQAYKMPEEKVLISGTFERIGIDNSFYLIEINGVEKTTEQELKNHEIAVKYLVEELINNGIISSINDLQGIGHRVVHGGSKYQESVVITDEVIQDIEELSSLAPLHNPAHLLGIRAFKKLSSDLLQVAIFDTAFHQTMPKEKYLYAAPYEWYEKYQIRKYGFHGTSHKYLTEKMSEITGEKGKFIICHLGNGGSITAVKDGKCYNTSMGFTPHAGIIMGTRSGDIDVSVLPYLMKKTNKTIDEVIEELNKKSGLLGLSGKSSDSRDIVSGVKENDERSILARDMFINSIVGYIARYYVELNGVDAICFSAGIGEKSIEMRTWILEKLSSLGIFIDYEKNNQKGKETIVTKDSSKIPCYVIPTNEEVMIARDTYSFI